MPGKLQNCVAMSTTIRGFYNRELQQWIAYFIWQAEDQTPKRPTSADGYCASKQVESMSRNGLQGTQPPC